MMDEMGGIKNQSHTSDFFFVGIKKVIGFGCRHPEYAGSSSSSSYQTKTDQIRKW